MPSWKFGSEKNDDANSSTTGASYRAGGQPNDESFLKKNKRNVIVTDKGWVRREHRLMNGGTATSVTRQIDEVLVAAGNKDAAPSSNLGFPDIAQIYFANSTNDDVTSITPETGGGGAEHQVRVVFNEPVKYSEAAYGTAAKAKVTLSRVTGSGNATIVATSTSRALTNTNITGANNTLIFRFTPTSGDAGTYKVAAATTAIANAVTGAVNLIGLENDSAAANVTITGAVSNGAILTITAHS